MIEFSWIDMLIGISIGMVFITLLVVTDIYPRINQLGKAICLERYNAEYVSYINGILTCNNQTQKTKYDGITVQIEDK
jgi:hypothetical protein